MEKKRGRMNKKGAEMTIGTIIVIILALVVLVVIIYGFMTGWGNLWQKLTGISGGKANIETNVQACQLACTTQSKYDYCKDRNVTLTDNSQPVPMKCEVIAADTRYGLDACPSIDCNAINTGTGTCGGLNGAWQKLQCNSTQEEVPLSSITNIADRGDNSYCCKVYCSKIPGAAWSKTACDSKSVSINDRLTDKETGKTEGDIMCCVAKPTK